jgi:hypothetical protein
LDLGTPFQPIITPQRVAKKPAEYLTIWSQSIWTNYNTRNQAVLGILPNKVNHHLWKWSPCKVELSEFLQVEVFQILSHFGNVGCTHSKPAPRSPRAEAQAKSADSAMWATPLVSSKHSRPAPSWRASECAGGGLTIVETSWWFMSCQKVFGVGICCKPI